LTNNKVDHKSKKELSEDYLLKLKRLKQKADLIKNQKVINEFLARCNKLIIESTEMKGHESKSKIIRKPFKL